MCSIQRSLYSAAVSPRPAMRCLNLCKPASMKSNGVPAVRECGWSKLHWAERPGRQGLLTGRSWQPKDAYERSKHQDPRSKEDPSTKIQSLRWFASSRNWCLDLGASLDLGAWILELRTAASNIASLMTRPTHDYLSECRRL